MSQFYVVNESTEDTFEASDNLQDAIRLARELASQGQAGDPVSVEIGGKAVKQYVRMADGTVAEQPIARPAKPGQFVLGSNLANHWFPPTVQENEGPSCFLD